MAASEIESFVVKLNTKNFMCSSCNQRFSNRYNAKRHIKNFHSKEMRSCDVGGDLEVQHPCTGSSSSNLLERTFGIDSYTCDFDSSNDDNLYVTPDLEEPVRDSPADIVLSEKFDIIPTTATKIEVQGMNSVALSPPLSSSPRNLFCWSSSEENDSLSDISSESEEESSLAELEFQSLYSFTNKQNSPITTTEHGALVLGYSLRHNCSHEAINDLLKLVDLHLPASNHSYKSYYMLKQKLGSWNTSDLKIIEYCEICSSIWPTDSNIWKCQTTFCNGTRYKDTDKKTLKTYFTISSMENQIKKVLERTDQWEKIKVVCNNRHKSSQNLRDIIDGSAYKELCQPGNLLHNNYDLTFTINTDGVALYKSSRIEIWPVYLAINELPAKERFHCKNIILWGVWQGQGKPPLHAFMEPFVEDMKKIAEKGVDVTLPDSSKRFVKFFPVVLTMDLIAKAQFLCMNQHNGQFGCKDCLIKGIHIPSGKGYARYYDYDSAASSAQRSDISFLRDAITAHETKTLTNGIKSISPILDLPYFSIVRGIVPDYMHGVLLGITKMLLGLWFDSGQHKNNYRQNHCYPNYFIGHELDTVDERLKNMNPPDHINRRPRGLKGNLHHLKANEYRTWLLYYSLPCLKDVLPNEYYSHYCCLVKGIHLLLKSSIDEEDIRTAKNELNIFYRDFSTLYEYHKAKIGLNVHNLIHLTDYVAMWGPLWAWSCFSFESLNGKILKQVHGTRNSCAQILGTLQALKSMYQIIDSNEIRPFMKDFLSKSLNSRKSNKDWKYVYDSCYIAGKLVPFKIDEDIQMLFKDIDVYNFNFEKALHLKWNNIVYVGEQYKRLSKTCNSLALVSYRSEMILVNILYFLYAKSERILLYIGKRLTYTASTNSSYQLEFPIMAECDEVILGYVDDILEKCFFLNGNSNYVTAMRIPNTIECD